MNTRRTNVRKAARPPARRPAPPADARVERTRHALGMALMDLMHERPLQDITVQHVLDRAGVARATFYTHFRDKRDLFLSENERFFEFLETLLEAPGSRPGRLAPVAELFAHVAEQGAYVRALRESGELDLIWRLITGQLAQMIERRRALLAPPPPDAPLPPAAEARIAAAGLAELLQWWLARDDRPSPEEIDRAWHEQVLRAFRGSRPDAAAVPTRRSR